MLTFPKVLKKYKFALIAETVRDGANGHKIWNPMHCALNILTTKFFENFLKVSKKHNINLHTCRIEQNKTNIWDHMHSKQLP